MSALPIEQEAAAFAAARHAEAQAARAQFRADFPEFSAVLDGIVEKYGRENVRLGWVVGVDGKFRGRLTPDQVAAVQAQLIRERDELQPPKASGYRGKTR